MSSSQRSWPTVGSRSPTRPGAGGARHRHLPGLRRHSLQPRRPALDRVPRACHRRDRRCAAQQGRLAHGRLPQHHAARHVRDAFSSPSSKRLSGKKVGVDFGVCVNPEFLREGTSVTDFLDPPKTVVGQSDERAGAEVMDLYDGPAGPALPGPSHRRRDDQVRRQQLPRPQGRLRQRDRGHLLVAGRRLPRRDGHLPVGHASSTSARRTCDPGSPSVAPACPRTCGR